MGNWTEIGRAAIIAGVSKTSKSSTGSKTDDLPFEEALNRLETVVEAMEGEDLPLETLLARYEEGMRLAKACQTKLAEAELKIQQLEKSAAGELLLKPTQLSGELDPGE